MPPSNSATTAIRQSAGRRPTSFQTMYRMRGLLLNALNFNVRINYVETMPKPLLSSPTKEFKRISQTPAERCRSGRTGRSRKPLILHGIPGFESLSLRHITLVSVTDRAPRPSGRGGVLSHHVLLRPTNAQEPAALVTLLYQSCCR